MVKSILTGRPGRAAIIGAEIAANAYIKKYPHTKLAKALKVAKKIHDKYKIVKLVYGTLKKIGKRELVERSSGSKKNEKKKNNGTDLDGKEKEMELLGKADTAVPCELITYDDNKDGTIRVDEFRLYVSKLGIRGNPAILDSIDQNGDDEISEEELVEFHKEIAKLNYVVDCE